MPGTTISSAIAHIESTPVAHLYSVRALTLHTAAPADHAAPMTDAELMRHNVEALCSHMLWLRAWWEGHEQAIRAADRRAAACIHDHFIDGAGFARSIARQSGFEMDEARMRNYSWGRSMQTVRMVGGVQ